MSLLITCFMAGFVCLFLDHRLSLHLYAMRRFWIFQAITAGFTVAFDAVARGRVWSIGQDGVLTIRLLGTPVELVLFGFVLLYASALAYEWLLRRIEANL